MTLEEMLLGGSSHNAFLSAIMKVDPTISHEMAAKIAKAYSDMPWFGGKQWYVETSKLYPLILCEAQGDCMNYAQNKFEHGNVKLSLCWKHYQEYAMKVVNNEL